MIAWKKNPLIYEINTWVWLTRLSGDPGSPLSLADVQDAQWEEIARMGFDAVWLMGVWERSPKGVDISNRHTGNVSDFRKALTDFTFEDNVGSPYCVKNYRVDSRIGGDEGLARARQKLASLGLRLILDFVPNHVAHDHPWVSGNPDFFIQGNREELRDDPITFTEINGIVYACGKDPYYPAWQDVLQVNAFHQGYRQAVVAEVTDIARRCDGVRCDMAMLMLNRVFDRTWGKRAGAMPDNEFWNELIPAVKESEPGFIFMAEAYWDTEWELQQLGFDYCYDKRLYDRLAHDTAESVRLHLMADAGYQSKLVRFVENHDETRHRVEFGQGRDRAAAVITATLPGAHLFYMGQFEGVTIRLPVFLRRSPAEAIDHDLQSFYHKLMGLAALPVFREGYWQLAATQGWPDNQTHLNLLAWCWCGCDTRIVVVINYCPSPSQGRVIVPGNELRGRTWRLNDPVSELTFERNGDEMHDPGLFVSLAPWHFHIFRFFAV